MKPAKPFVKYPGGKSWLIPEFAKLIEPIYGPPGSTIPHYFEPFVGGGAIFWWIMQNYNVEKATICDTSLPLICAYRAIKRDANVLIKYLDDVINWYSLSEDAENYYYNKRDLYNSYNVNSINDLESVRNDDYRCEMLAKWFIFLNRTCFNGLMRVNSKGEFNSPIGRKPKTKEQKKAGEKGDPVDFSFDAENLINCSKILKDVEILHGDYKQIEGRIKWYSLLFFDPPYLPASKTANFTRYSGEFGLDEQERLAIFCEKIERKCVYIAQANSDVDEIRGLYKPPRWKIKETSVRRSINSNGAKRGKISELIITNF